MNPKARSAFSSAGAALGVVIAAVVIIAIVIAVPVGIYVGIKTIHRGQQRADRNQARSQLLKDERNKVQVYDIQIGQQEQRVKIAKQNAAIRRENAVGIREAQDEISSTLTPLYVQFEEIQAQKQIAVSGRNATVIYVPVGSDGRPIVTQTAPAVKP